MAPPALSNQVTVSVGNANSRLFLDNARDYRLNIVEPLKKDLWIEGGRNVVVVGGQITIDQLGGESAYQDNTAVKVRFGDPAGTVHVEGLRRDGTDVRVLARGLRNVYDLAFDEDGRLYGADNDGETRAGWRREEVLEVREGANYGYPFDGTFGPHTQRRAPPLWLLDTVGSAGVEWLRWDLRPTLVVGSCGDVYAVELAEVRGTVTVRNRAAVRHLLAVPGCVTAVERLPAGRLLMTLFTFRGSPRVYVVRLEP